MKQIKTMVAAVKKSVASYVADVEKRASNVNYVVELQNRMAEVDATAAAKKGEAAQATAASSATASEAFMKSDAQRNLDDALVIAQASFGERFVNAKDKDGYPTIELKTPFFARSLTRMRVYSTVESFAVSCATRVQSVCKTLVNNKFKVLAGVAACALGVACYKNPKILMNAKEVAQDLFATASKSLSR